ncbi:hypothetical protein CNR22_21300 [Sphingobacteriaceae bacterium]|nr:hypothetical protein CNR22_21300 [Sphingobacteriaceae bacterium]
MVCFQSFAQKKDKSASFPEPEGWCKLVQLKNTNTCFLEFTKKEGIKVMLYDSLRKKIGSGKLATKLIDDKLGYHILSGIYEINGDVVIFFEKGEDKTPIMIRLIVDGKTGKLKAEDKIAELEKMSMKDGYAIAFGGLDIPDIRIVKDPESDYYAMIRYNTLAAETKDRIEVFHFSPDHKIINKANYTTPNNKYKYTRYLNAYVHKDEYVILGTYAFNTDKSGGDESRFYISQLSKGKTTFLQKELGLTEYYKHPTSEFVYNNVKGIVHMIIMPGGKSSGEGINIVFQNFKPSTLAVEKSFVPDASKVNDYYRNTIGSKDDFAGMIQGAFVDKSGNLVLMFQETTIKIDKFGTVTATFLGDVALLSISAEGKTINGAVYPFSSVVSGDHSMYNSNKIKTGFRPAYNFDDKGLASEQYYGIDFISTENASYLLFNNMPKNMETDDVKSIKTVKAISGSTAVKYIYKGDAIKKDYLFKKPKEKDDVTFCLFGCSSYYAPRKSYATIYTDPETEKSSVVWIKLD